MPTVAPPAAVAAAADVAESPSLTAAPTVAPPAAVTAAADEAEDAPSKCKNAKNAKAKTAMAPPPPLF